MSNPYPPQPPQPGTQSQPYVGSAQATSTIAPPPAYVRTNVGEYWKNAPNGKRNLSILAAAFLVLLVIGSVIRGGGSTTTTTTDSGNSSQSSGGGSHPAATAVPASWHTVTTFKGNGQKKTATFIVGKQWKLQWSCTPSSFYGGQYNVIVEVKSPSDDSVDDFAVNTLCKSGNATGETQEYTAGTFYLDVNSEAAWALVVQDYH